MTDEDSRELNKLRHSNDIPGILSGLVPFKKDIRGVVAEFGNKHTEGCTRSSLPENSGLFERHCNAVTVRYQTSSKI